MPATPITPGPGADAPPAAADLTARLRAATGAIAAWLAAPSDEAWTGLRRQVAAMDAYAPLCSRAADPALAREAQLYSHQLTALRARLQAWAPRLQARRAQLRQTRSDLEGLRAWRDALESITP